jgi:peptide/nickel transport system substrate-binding protein
MLTFQSVLTARRFRLLSSGFAALAASVALTACGGGNGGGTSPAASTPAKNTEAAAADVVPGATLNIARASEVASLDPGALATTEDYNTQEALYDALVRPADDGQSVVPGLASAWKVDDAAKTYTFTMRPGLKFSDGSPLTSADAKFSILYAKKGSTYGNLLSAIKTITTPDDSTVVLHITHEDNLLLPGLAFAFVVPTDFGGKAKAAFFKRPLSSGPFTMTAWSVGNTMSLEKNTNFWNADKVSLGKVEYHVTHDTTARINAVKADQDQLNEYLPTAQIAQLSKEQVYRVDPSARNTLLWTNNAKAPFDDVKVRQAAALALDRPTLLKAVWSGYGAPVQGIIPPGVPNSQSKLTGADTWPFDVAKAKASLAASKTPHPTITLLVAYEGGIDATLTSAVQEELEDVGFKVKTQVTDFATAVNQAISGSFQMFLVPNASFLPTAGEAMGFYVSTFGAVGGWDTKKADTYLEQFRTATDDAGRDAAVTAFEAWNQELANIIPVGVANLFMAKSPRLSGLKVSPFDTYRLDEVGLTK